MKGRLAKLLAFIRREWPLEISVTLFLAVVLLLLGYQLNSLLPGQSPAEQQTTIITSSLPDIMGNILFWPYYATVYAARQLIDDPVLASRLVSASFGFLTTFSLFVMIKRWFSTNVAIVGTTIFIANSWFLQTARTGAPDILIPAVLISLWASSLWLINRPKKLLPGVVTSILIVCSVFVPVIPLLTLLVAAVAALRFRGLFKMLKKRQLAILASAALTLLLILISGLFNNPDQTKVILGIPTAFTGISMFYSGFIDTLAAIFWLAPSNPSKWLSTLPLLDIFGVVMFTLGVYHHERNFGGRRSFILFGTLFTILLVLVMNSGVNYAGFSAMLPIVAIFIISGVQEFTNIWTKVFPRNPLTRILSALVLSVLITTSSLYQLNRYFIAWPQAPETNSAFIDRNS